MRLTVCELPDDAKRRESAWAELTRHLRASPTDVLVLFGELDAQVVLGSRPIEDAGNLCLG